MDNLNVEYFDGVKAIQTANNMHDIDKSIKNLQSLQVQIVNNYPEFLDSIIDIDYHIACGAYRINNIDLFEHTIQKHYYNDYRFKKLYSLFQDVTAANVWNDIIKSNTTNLERTFVRSLSVVILTCVCLSLVMRK